MEEAKAVERRYMENPLLAFSFYTQLQTDVTRRLGQDVLAALDEAIGREEVDATTLNRAYGQFWLWVLAAYEVTRTMSQAKRCFREAIAEKVVAFKRRIAGIRIPFAKQEYPGGGDVAIGAEASIAGIDSKKRDMTFVVRGVAFSARSLMTEFDALIRGIERGDVLHRHGWRGKDDVT